MVPGLSVGRLNSQAYSIGARGFVGGLANKTLVLIDGRPVYDPLFGGTFWNVQDVLLEDLDRIEVIRGPGPTLWGSNAVNGVINVITKGAKDTQGVYVSGGGGTEERAFAETRYGFQIDENSWMRVYGKWLDRDSTVDGEGDSAHDDWDMWRGGFRYDRETSEDINLTFQGDAYHSDRIGEFIRQFPVPGANLQFGQSIRDARNSGGSLIFRLSQNTEDQGWSFQSLYDRTERVTNVDFRVHRDTFDLDFQHYFHLGDAHELRWGVGARHTRDESNPGVNTALIPSDRSLDTFTAFIQDTITLAPDRLFATIGSKFEHNDYTGFEIQPSARLWYTPSDRHTFWAAVSRPVRTPTRIEEEGFLTFGIVDTGLAAGLPPSGIFVPFGVSGSEDLDAERVFAYEGGYRVKLTDNLALDASIFYNDYSRLIFVPETVIGAFNNDGFGETYGGELLARWRVADNFRVEASYTFVDVQIHGPIFAQDEGNTPHHQAQLRSYLDITDNLELNGALYYVDRVPTVDARDYLRFDIGLTWRPTHNLELSVYGQNLFDPQHREFSGINEIERSVFFQASLRF